MDVHIFVHFEETEKRPSILKLITMWFSMRKWSRMNKNQMDDGTVFLFLFIGYSFIAAHARAPGAQITIMDFLIFCMRWIIHEGPIC